LVFSEGSRRYLRQSLLRRGHERAFARPPLRYPPGPSQVARMSSERGMDDGHFVNPTHSETWIAWACGAERLARDGD